MRHKLLSSGVTKGAVGEGSCQATIVDPARRADPPRIWEGYTLRLAEAAGRPVAERRVAGFDYAAGVLALDVPLDAAPPTGTLYELYSDEEAPIVAVRYLLGLRRTDPIPPVSVRLGTTRGT